MVDFHIDKPTLRPYMCHAIEQMRGVIVCLMSDNAVLMPDARRVSAYNRIIIGIAHHISQSYQIS